MSNFNPTEIYRQLVESGDAWAEADALARQLEELRKPLLNNLKTQSAEKSDAARETEAYADSEYKQHVEAMCSARLKANKTLVKYNAMKVLAELRRTEQSNIRATMRDAV